MGLKNNQRLKRVRQRVIDRDGMICCYCDYPLSTDKITMEHIVPHSKWGDFTVTNLTVACHDCNNRRGSIYFFDYCQRFNFSVDKIAKYKKLYFGNLKIKILNIAMEKFLIGSSIIPLIAIQKARATFKKSGNVDFFIDYEKKYNLSIQLSKPSDLSSIKKCFQTLIKIIELESAE